MNISRDAQAAVREYGADVLRAAAELAERREKAAPAFASLGFDLADRLGIDQATKGDPQGRRWAAAVRSRIDDLLAEPAPQVVEKQPSPAGDDGVEPRPEGTQPGAERESA